MVWKNVFHQKINELWERAKDKDYRLTLEAYAKRIGTTRSSLRGWLSGKGQPDADGFIRVATAEDVSLAWLLGDKREFREYSQQEQAMLQRFRFLSDIHKEDICAFVDRYYEQDYSVPSRTVEKKTIS